VHNDLLNQARRLARLDAQKPKQANLRRSVSAAYYSLFHFLVDQSCRAAIGSLHQQSDFRAVLGRSFEHTSMRDACRSFDGGTLPAHVSKGLPAAFAIPIAIRRVAGMFVELQARRNLADYDLTERFVRSEVLWLIDQVRDAMDRFKTLSNSTEKRFFLACLWAWRTLSKR
jgi:hypothetical protein